MLQIQKNGDFPLDIIYKIFTEKIFIISFLVFSSVMTLLFYSSLPFKKAETKRRKTVKRKVIIEEKPFKGTDNPGKLIVPETTYNTLKKEGLIHSPEENFNK